MGNRWTVVVVLLSSLCFADGTFGTALPYSRFTAYGQPTLFDLNVGDGGEPLVLNGRISSNYQPRSAYAVVLYVSEVRTAGAVRLRVPGNEGAVSVRVDQPGWYQWPLPVTVSDGSFELDTEVADVTFKYSCFNRDYFMPSERYRTGYVGLGWLNSGPCTGVLRLTVTSPTPGCPVEENDAVAGIPYVETPLLPAGLERQRVRLPDDFSFGSITAPMVIRWFESQGAEATRVIMADGGVQTRNANGSFTYPVAGPFDGGPVAPFVLEFSSDGTNLSAGLSYAPGPCHPAARASFGGEDSRWLGGPVGADLIFKFVPWFASQHYLDRDGDGFAGADFEWHVDPDNSFPNDCDDASELRHPSAGERCNGIDDDCDGTVDGPTVALDPCERDAGVCFTARHDPADCVDGAWLSCETQGRYPAAFRAEEVVCDGVDEDCDGVVDDAPRPVSCALTGGVCAGSSTSRCVAGAWEACDYGPDFELRESSCDGLDNDCDGLVDGADPDVPLPQCALQAGVCANSTPRREACSVTGWLTCTASDYGALFEPEETRCDGLDNDCDGLVDAADSDLELAPCEKQLGVCAGLLHIRSECSSTGWVTCGPERFPATWEAVESRCDGLDNDCDGVTDEGCRLALSVPGVDRPGQGCSCGAVDGVSALVALLVLARRRWRRLS